MYSSHDRAARPAGRSFCISGRAVCRRDFLGAGFSRSSARAASLTSGNGLAIGVAADLSGPVSWVGWGQANSVQLAVDQINAAGGIDIGGTNYTLTLVSADSECNPAQAVTATNTLLGAGVVAVIGPTCSSASSAAQPLYAAAGVPMVGASASASDITEQGYSTTFRVISRDDASAPRLAMYFLQELSSPNAALVEFDGYWGNFATDAFSETFSSLGGTITSRNTISSTGDYTATLTGVMAENPDVIHIAHEGGATAGLLSKVAENLGMGDVMIAWTSLTLDRSVLTE